MASIGIIGAGKIGLAFAQHAARAGYDTIISNSRGPETLQAAVEEIGHGIKAGTVQEAAAADIVFLSVTWPQIEKAVSTVPTWEGKLVIDATNPVLPGFVPAPLNGQPSSQVVANLVPGARVVKAFNTILHSLLAASPQEADGNRVVFYSGDDQGAKGTVLELITRLGFAGVDLGTLAEAAKLQQFPGGSLPGLNLIQLK
ncbi:NADPH-dependent F420 reductase [Rufibacter latericius]|uniref:NADP oxidoreductase n=1 Tax=Rufibacter latericius TaxID=2487040 RepID=A0A3M9MU48_9BACT|nr:NAD(P)-binding domain-containing protein [Rufibacter latericius]RNI28707.1 NADP oxidoreductase [Rufibacter latericius]